MPDLIEVLLRDRAALVRALVLLGRKPFLKCPVPGQLVLLELRPRGRFGIARSRRALKIEIDDLRVELAPRAPVIDRRICAPAVPAAWVERPMLLRLQL